ncbi:F-box protein At5g03100 isoform X1 [Lactuca sativa]|nr:F-box protein At5g03100 isoform X1 [Lactuca sativa]
MKMLEEGEHQTKIAQKQIKFQEVMEKVEEDAISALPDCLLQEILSRLPSTKDAIKTGTLSKRWKHLWTSIPTLILSHSNYPIASYCALSVDKTLAQCRQLKLKKFEVHTFFEIRFESLYKNWIRYAISCNVEELNLEFQRWDWQPEFLLDHSVFFINSCFTDLTLSYCILNPIGAISWKNLRTLCIICGSLDEDLIENILCGSPVLETLVLHNCYGCKRLDITSKSVKNLVLSGFKFDIIEMNAPNILSLTIEGELLLSRFLLVNVTSLVKANLNRRCRNSTNVFTMPEAAEQEMFKEFILNLGHVKELEIGFDCSKVISCLQAKGFVVPSNVKLTRIE